jgi:Family of unknown function (DUF5681)
MSKRVHTGPRQKGAATSRRGADYTVGYGRPPKGHQFQPGQSGNRGGRPKGRKNTATLVREILDRKIEIRSGNTTRKISLREAILTRFAESALKADTKSAAFLLQRYDALETAGDAGSDAVSPDEQEIIDKYMQAYLTKKGENA